METIDCFSKLEADSANSRLDIINQLSKSDRVGHRKCFETKTTNSVIKIDKLVEVENLPVMKTNKRELCFGYNYANVFADVITTSTEVI